jgi:aerobic-type carbon monoxide dehydrogenase small subunit (CoxS/CutS family)
MACESEAERPVLSRREFLKEGAVATAVVSSGLLKIPEAEAREAAPASTSSRISLQVNGERYTIDVENRWSLLYILREQLHLTGAKQGCDGGQCGSCTVLIGGTPQYACMVLGVAAQGKEILTVEGLTKGDALHPIQQAFSDEMGFQCGYCTPGFVMATKALLDRTPKPTEAEIRRGLAGTLCRCCAYPKIVKSVQTAATRLAS